MRVRQRSGIVLVSLFGVVAGLAVLSPPAGAEETLEKALQTSQKKRQQEAAAVREVIARLDLNDQQVRRLLALAADAAKLHVEAYQTEARLQPEMLEAFAEFAREDSLDQGFTPSVEQRTARLIQESKATDERITARLIDLEKQATAILTPPQQQLIKESGQAAETPHKTKTAAPNQPPELLRGHPAQRAAAAWQADEKDPLILARRAMQTLHRQIHPELGPVGQNLLHPVAAVTLCQKLGTVANQDVREAAEIFDHGTTDYPMSQCLADKNRLARVRAEISNWNLINGLHLNGRQIDKIVALYGEAAIDGTAPSRPANKKPKHDAERQLAARVQLERSVEAVLNPGQQRVLAEFKPCLIPPKNLKDPVRVGQANDHSQQENWLSRARKMPEPQLRKSIDNVLAAEARHFGELNEQDRAARVALLIDAAQEAAKMTDVEFEINKADLAEKITPPDRIMQLKEKIAAISRERSLPGTISQFMLNQGFVDQLRARGQQLARGAGGKPAGQTAGLARQ